jgi:catechol 2,3-dioxygenase-like lactoylglutathione lyase family enzyme
MKFEIGSPLRAVFIVKSYDQCREFYEQCLGLSIDREWDRGSGDRGVVYELAGTHLELLEGANDPAGDGVYLYIPVKDVDVMYARLSAVAKVAVPLATQPWGHRNFMILDPAGAKLKFYAEV